MFTTHFPLSFLYAFLIGSDCCHLEDGQVSLVAVILAGLNAGSCFLV